MGALQLQQSVVAFPDAQGFADQARRFRALVGELGGQTLAVWADPVLETDAKRLAEEWEAARNAEYRELIAESGKFVDEIGREFSKEKFTLAELDEEEAELEKLQRWHERIRARDVLGAPAAAEAETALEEAGAALARYSSAVFERTQP
jgi:Protein ChrB, N-terminal